MDSFIDSLMKMGFIAQRSIFPASPMNQDVRVKGLPLCCPGVQLNVVAFNASISVCEKAGAWPLDFQSANWCSPHAEDHANSKDDFVGPN